MKPNPTLRNRVMKSLENSNEKRPVSITMLRALCADDPDQLDEFYRLLDELNVDHIVQRKAGMKEGKQQLHYWLTQPVQTPAAASEPAKPAPIVHQVKPTSPVQQKPNPPAQKKRLQNSPTRGTGQAIVDIVQETPGIGISALHSKLILQYPDITEKKVIDMAYYLSNYGTQPKLASEGKRATMKLFPRGLHVAKPAPIPPETIKQTYPNAKPFGCAIRMDCGMTIVHGDDRIELNPDTALQLMKFCSHQLSYAAETLAV